MIEVEANNVNESLNALPASVLSDFSKTPEVIDSIALLPWSEHCTECAIPDCFQTCDLYEARIGGRCRRFVNGMVRIDHGSGPVPYVTKVQFKRWAKLEAVGNCRLRSLEDCRRVEQWDQMLGGLIFRLPLPYSARSYLSGKRYGWKKRWSRGQAPHSSNPDAFLLEVYNPQNEPVRISLEIRPCDPAKAVLPFLSIIEVPPGYSRNRVAGHEIAGRIDLREEFLISLVPNDVADGTALYFGIMSFIRDAAANVPSQAEADTPKERLTKCVIWDLDNTLWDGVAVESKPEDLVLRVDVVDVIKLLDRHGVLNSIASKNTHDHAMNILKHFGIDEYFVAPQISWMPKSESIRTIGAEINIGLDTLTFVDDSSFERQEVSSVFPEVRVIDAADYALLRDLPECKREATEDSANRRRLYQAQESRKSAQEDFHGDYLKFLESCEMQMSIDSLREATVERVHELAQRTNQMNFSGNRYRREDLDKILADPGLETYVINCTDKFGTYGAVGFSVVDRSQARMIDLMFSCRIQSRRVEHAFLAFVLRRYAELGRADFFVRYRKTDRNAPSGKVFEDFGLELDSENDGVRELRFDLTREIPDDRIVRTEFIGL